MKQKRWNRLYRITRSTALREENVIYPYENSYGLMSKWMDMPACAKIVSSVDS